MEKIPEETGFKDDIRTLKEVQQLIRVIEGSVSNKDYR